jgi:hypothetical protein
MSRTTVRVTGKAEVKQRVNERLTLLRGPLLRSPLLRCQLLAKRTDGRSSRRGWGNQLTVASNT